MCEKKCTNFTPVKNKINSEIDIFVNKSMCSQCSRVRLIQNTATECTKNSLK